MKPIYLCCHCNTQVTGTKRFCEYCTTTKKRREMDEVNKKHFKEHNLEYNCKFCEKI